MYSKFQLAKKFIGYKLTASNGKGHGIHSPFVFDLVTKVLNDKTQYAEYFAMESLRSELLNDRTVLLIDDFGAGSRTNLQKKRTVAEIAASSLKPKKFSQLLFRLVKYYQSKNIIELGTSLGITTAYLASANKSANVITMEGAPAVASVAKNNFSKLGLKNIKLIEGNFDNTLPSIINQQPSTNIDFAFIDGNHRKEPTLNYFYQLLNASDENTIMIFDDIHWSKEMEDAWNEIKQHDSVSLTVDLFFIGLVFFRKENKEKENFVIRF